MILQGVAPFVIWMARRAIPTPQKHLRRDLMCCEPRTLGIPSVSALLENNHFIHLSKTFMTMLTFEDVVPYYIEESIV